MSSCTEWTRARDRDGYGLSQIAGKTRRVHRLVFYCFHGYYPPVVMHTCDNPPCINIEHLAGGTVAQNNADRARKGRSADAKGLANNNGKLSDLQVMEIRSLLDDGEPIANVAHKYGVSKSHIYNIRCGHRR